MPIDLDGLDKLWETDGDHWAKAVGSCWFEISRELRAARAVVEAARYLENPKRSIGSLWTEIDTVKDALAAYKEKT